MPRRHGKQFTIESLMAEERKIYRLARAVEAAPISTQSGDRMRITHFMATDSWPYWIASGYAQIGRTTMSVYFECEREELFTQYYPAFKQIVESIRLVSREHAKPK